VHFSRGSQGYFYLGQECATRGQRAKSGPGTEVLYRFCIECNMGAKKLKMYEEKNNSLLHFSYDHTTSHAPGKFACNNSLLNRKQTC